MRTFAKMFELGFLLFGRTGPEGSGDGVATGRSTGFAARSARPGRAPTSFAPHVEQNRASFVTIA
jgi:hypothetical protein